METGVSSKNANCDPEHVRCIGPGQTWALGDPTPTRYRFDQELADMHAAASTVAEVLPLRTKEIRFRRDWRARRSPEVEVALVAVPHADAAPLHLADEDVLPRERSELLSRAVNVAVAATALLLMAPIIALIALAVRLTSKGPVLYSQVRVGVDRRYRHASSYDRRGQDLGGRPFMMYKFRSMRVDAEAGGQAVWAVKRDPRVTPIGEFLRRTRLDELPQLWNVIRGDMNIVGPRPERPSIFADLRNQVPQYSMRQRVKPGITGWAQINQCYDSCIDDVKRKVQYDIEYMKQQGLLMDMRIMSRTLPVMIGRRGGW